ncbi:MAG: DUF1553 domain-containing protein [Limisphaerales bacterium]
MNGVRFIALLSAVWVPLLWADDYSKQVLADKPSLYFRYDQVEGSTIKSEVGGLEGALAGNASITDHGPRGKAYPDFPSKNAALKLSGAGQFLRVKDPGAESILDFAQGDSITMEAWVNPRTMGTYSYVIGKGRTGNPGQKADNQNYSLRLAKLGSSAGITFLFRDAKNSGDSSWHRWTSKTGFTLGGWHHVAISYTFGKPETIRGYIDGEPVQGIWDKGGGTDQAPWMDDDELWIGAALGGQISSTLIGGIDEVALYRHAVSAERMKRRYRFDAPRFTLQPEEAPRDHVRIDLHEGVSEGWNLIANDPVVSFREPSFAIPFIPKKYNARGIIEDRPDVFLLRAESSVEMPEGKVRVLLRSRTMSRLWLDGKVVATLGKALTRTSAHGKVSAEPANLGPVTRLLRPGTQETVVEVDSVGGVQHLLLEAFVGGAGKRRPETGELCVAVSVDGKPFQIISPEALWQLTDANWRQQYSAAQERMLFFNSQRRAALGHKENERWTARHQIVREWAAKHLQVTVPAAIEDFPAQNPIDHFINAKLKQAGRDSMSLTDDDAFLRRVSLDANGIGPSESSQNQLMQDQSPNRRAKAIDRLLDNELAWADHWTSYWQDVLAENPNILKPKLNNTGPFRFWIHESLQDNKPMDRFVTELIMMEGSQYYGGPRGFGVATQNDVPMAAKAQVVGQAFLGMQMKCARCHDAPFHSYNQKDLFSMAAMLSRKPVAVPKTSSVPVVPGHKSRVEVSLVPGTAVKPDWPFKADELSEPISNDSRAQLAAMITHGHGERFAEVIVNRVWQRYLGWGLVEPADDWENAEASHPGLLKWLAREFLLSGYDLKHVVRLIMNSHAYQRQVDPAFIAAGEAGERVYAGPARRRLSAEQVVDSLFAVAGKEMGVEPLTLDINGRGTITTFLNLGTPRRAWQFTSLSNERDRPSLAIPKAQSVVDVLQTFGWRDARQDALTRRDHEPNVLQPSALANGIVGRRIAQLSDDSAFTELALRTVDCRELVHLIYRRVLGRAPSKEELITMDQYLCVTYANRVVKNAPQLIRQEKVLDVSWNNHLSEEANQIKVELEKRVLTGDPPTNRLRPEWRERLEDVVYALVNSPEFIFVP